MIGLVITQEGQNTKIRKIRWTPLSEKIIQNKQQDEKISGKNDKKPEVILPTVIPEKTITLLLDINSSQCEKFIETFALKTTDDKIFAAYCLLLNLLCSFAEQYASKMNEQDMKALFDIIDFSIKAIPRKLNRPLCGEKKEQIEQYAQRLDKIRTNAPLLQIQQQNQRKENTEVSDIKDKEESKKNASLNSSQKTPRQNNDEKSEIIPSMVILKENAPDFNENNFITSIKSSPVEIYKTIISSITEDSVDKIINEYRRLREKDGIFTTDFVGDHIDSKSSADEKLTRLVNHAVEQPKGRTAKALFSIALVSKLKQSIKEKTISSDFKKIINNVENLPRVLPYLSPNECKAVLQQTNPLLNRNNIGYFFNEIWPLLSEGECKIVVPTIHYFVKDADDLDMLLCEADGKLINKNNPVNLKEIGDKIIESHLSKFKIPTVKDLVDILIMFKSIKCDPLEAYKKMIAIVNSADLAKKVTGAYAALRNRHTFFKSRRTNFVTKISSEAPADEQLKQLINHAIDKPNSRTAEALFSVFQAKPPKGTEQASKISTNISLSPQLQS